MNVIVSNKNQDILSNLDIDLIKSINGEFTPEEIAAQFPSNFYFNKMVLDITAIKGYQNINVIQSVATFTVNGVTSDIISHKDLYDKIVYGKQDVASYHQLNNVSSSKSSSLNTTSVDQVEDSRLRVIGFKNVTSGAGATTLVYILKKQLEKLYGVLAVEVGKNDFTYLNDKALQRTDDLASFINQNQRSEVILVDLNEADGEDLCTDIIYLIEPGLIKLNKLIRKDSMIFDKLKGKKIVLNRSILSDKDVQDFENESASNIFFNIPNLDDKKEYYKVLEDFLVEMEFLRFKPDKGSKNKNIFSIFKQRLNMLFYLTLYYMGNIIVPTPKKKVEELFMDEFLGYLNNNGLDINDLSGEEFAKLLEIYNTYVRYSNVVNNTLKNVSYSVVNCDSNYVKYANLARSAKTSLDYSIAMVKSRKNSR